MLSIVDPVRTSALIPSRHRDPGHGRVAPEPAHGRAPARDAPAGAGVTWAVESREGVRHHAIEINAEGSGSVGAHIARRSVLRKRKIAPPMIA
ncbi:MAG: hypothetical protein ABIP93_08315 [Gemmatimonadaceae bacterium]